MEYTTSNSIIAAKNVSTETDFFNDLYSDSSLKQATMAIFYTATIFGLILEFGVIWYERGGGNQRYRTAINQLFSTLSWIVVSYILFVYIPEGIRYLGGPLSPAICDVQLFLKNVISASIVLNLNFITLLRYIFIFNLSNFAVINDNLIARFLQMTIFLLSVWTATVKKMSIGRMPMNYFLCAGKDPNKGHSGSIEMVVHKYESTGILVVLSFVLNICAFVKIFAYQRKMEKSTQSIELGHIIPSRNNLPQPTFPNPNKRHSITNVPKSMVDLTTQILIIIFQISFVVMVMVMNQVKPIDLNKYENRWMVYLVQIVAAAVALLGISVIYYVKNNSLPKAISREIKERMKY